MDQAPAQLPLAGVKVIEICNVAAGPFCGLLLADMGAEITKIEPPDGDMLRSWPPHRDGYSENFASLNRGKRSIVLDLKNPADLAIATKLVLAADVLLENSRPGVLDRLGLGYESLSARCPSLVYCSISAYGQTGPRSRQGGFDVTMQAASGIMSVTGEPDGMPVKCGVPVADFTAGLYGAYAIAAALMGVRAGGPGMHVDVPMLGTSLAIAALQTSEYFGNGVDPRALGSAHPRNAPYQAFRASDRAFVVAAGNDKLWQAVCEVLDEPALPADPRFRDVAARARNQAALASILNARFQQRPAATWVALLAERGVPVSLINTYSEAMADEQVAASGWVAPLMLPNGAETRTFLSPLRLNGIPASLRSGPPALDGDREAILSEINTPTETGASASD